MQQRPLLFAILLLAPCLVAAGPPPAAPSVQEQITVLGHRRHYFPAPMADNRIEQRGDSPGFGPGSRLGSATIEGGPTGDQVHHGVTAGIAVPVAGVRGLDFTLSATGSRDAMMPAGTTAAATATAGLRLRF